MKKTKKSKYPMLACTPKRLPNEGVVDAARIATAINPMNRPSADGMLDVVRGGSFLDVQRISVLTKKKWHTNGVRLTVGFLDNPEAALRTRIVKHMNAWAKMANVQFIESSVDPEVRIARLGGEQGGYWSYLGTDILSIAKGQPTMNLEAFTMNTPESEFRRVVRHETGHTLGFPHEHMRKALVALIDQAKAIVYFGQTQGWTEAEVKAQVLTPIEESSLIDPTNPDPNSIMCYQIPGTITKSGNPIIGGIDIDELDYQYAGKIYPKAASMAHTFPKVTKFHSSVRPDVKRGMRKSTP